MYGAQNYPSQPMYPQFMPFAVQPQMQSQQQRPHYDVVKVNGKNGAEAFEIGANSSILLLDTTEPIIWYKETDGAGYPRVTPYRITPIEVKPETAPMDTESIKDLLASFEASITSKMEAIINGKPNPVADKSKQARTDFRTDAKS